MQREYKIERYNVSKKWPLFWWEQCANCKKEYRRTRLWDVSTRRLAFSIRGSIWKHIILCKHCASTPKQAYDLAMKIDVDPRKLKKPPPPPPPPKPNRAKKLRFMMDE